MPYRSLLCRTSLSRGVFWLPVSRQSEFTVEVRCRHRLSTWFCFLDQWPWPGDLESEAELVGCKILFSFSGHHTISHIWCNMYTYIYTILYPHDPSCIKYHILLVFNSFPKQKPTWNLKTYVHLSRWRDELPPGPLIQPPLLDLYVASLAVYTLRSCWLMWKDHLVLLSYNI